VDCFGKTKPLTPKGRVNDENFLGGGIESESMQNEPLFVLKRDMQLNCPVCDTKGFLPMDWKNRPGFLEVVTCFGGDFDAIARCSSCGHNFAEWKGDHWEGEGMIISYEAPAWRRFRTATQKENGINEKTKEIYSSLFRAARAAALARTKEVVVLQGIVRKLRDKIDREGLLSSEESDEIDAVLVGDCWPLSLNRREKPSCL
jgi:hypothetical protein